jgi:hypothetical protein
MTTAMTTKKKIASPTFIASRAFGPPRQERPGAGGDGDGCPVSSTPTARRAAPRSERGDRHRRWAVGGPGERSSGRRHRSQDPRKHRWGRTSRTRRLARRRGEAPCTHVPSVLPLIQAAVRPLVRRITSKFGFFGNQAPYGERTWRTRSTDGSWTGLKGATGHVRNHHLMPCRNRCGFPS